MTLRGNRNRTFSVQSNIYTQADLLWEDYGLIIKISDTASVQNISIQNIRHSKLSKLTIHIQIYTPHMRCFQ